MAKLCNAFNVRTIVCEFTHHSAQHRLRSKAEDGGGDEDWEIVKASSGMCQSENVIIENSKRECALNYLGNSAHKLTLLYSVGRILGKGRWSEVEKQTEPRSKLNDNMNEPYEMKRTLKRSNKWFHVEFSSEKWHICRKSDATESTEWNYSAKV